MPLRESDAFVLITYPMGEADKVAVMFTREFGKIRAVARGARRPKSLFGASLEPLSEVHVSFFEKETRELVSLRRCELLMSPFERACTPEGELFLHHIGEVTDRFQPLSEPNDRIYRLLKAIVETFRSAPDLNRLSAYFDIWMLKLSGFLGHWDRCLRCQHPYRTKEEILVGADGTTFCQKCPPPVQYLTVGEDVRQAIEQISRLDPLSWTEQEVSPTAMQKIKQLAHLLITTILEHHLRTEIIFIAYHRNERRMER
ncbi:MAG TPA: DNA repair protein RecO [Blastocatellia bacterium]|nr:DNA repair protein RecO [Blastocatellia bacterium]